VKESSKEHLKIAMAVLKGWLETSETSGVGLVACLARTCRKSAGGFEIRAARASLDLGKSRKRHQDSTDSAGSQRPKTLLSPTRETQIWSNVE
jgi:hypothetical protein